MIPRFPGDPPKDLSRPLEEVKILVDKPLDGARLDRALVRFLTWRSRNSIHRLIRDGHVLLEGRRARPATKVRMGEVLRIKIPKRPEPQAPVAPDDTDIHILHEDRYMIAVDKPPGLAVHPAGRRVHGTLIHFLHTRYRRPQDPDHDVVPRLLHRIDRETSGVVMASLHEDFHSQVARQFEDRKVQKTYLAVVHGCPEPVTGLIDLGIENHLGDARAVPQIHENHATVVPPAQNPAHQYDFFSNIFRAQLTATVSSSHVS